MTTGKQNKIQTDKNTAHIKTLENASNPVNEAKQGLSVQNRKPRLGIIIDDTLGSQNSFRGRWVNEKLEPVGSEFGFNVRCQISELDNLFVGSFFSASIKDRFDTTSGISDNWWRCDGIFNDRGLGDIFVASQNQTVSHE